MTKARRAKREFVELSFGRIISGGESKEVHKAEPPRALTQEEALEVLWSAKGCYMTDAEGLPLFDENKEAIPNPKWCDAFVYATLSKDTEFYVTDRKTRTVKAGTRVLVTMVSRIGDVGIRDNHLVPASNGYQTRVPPETLTDWNMAP